MFAFFRRTFRKTKSSRPLSKRRFRLESLESRNCPSAVGLEIQAQTAAGHNVAVEGQVMGLESSYQVALSGPVSASFSLHGSGAFSYIGPATGLGIVTANVSDSDGDTAQASANISDPPPQVSSLMVEATGQGKQVDVSGTVTAQSPGGLSVQFSGSAGLAASSATTDSGGNFSLLTTATGLGNVSAMVTDVWGVSSPTLTTTLEVARPQIIGFTAVRLGNGLWQFQGTVSGPDASGDSVQLSGLASATATPNASGTFSETVYLGNGPSGVEYATATDIWGQTSDQVSYMFFG